MSEDRPDPDATELPSTEAAPPPSGNHQQIGPYRLLQKLGEGGMGEVWLAEQQEPVQRKVALKIIKQGMDTKQVVARFEAERQALAMMDHPAVAKVFDAGTTPRGRPYFVMEYVKGVPITEHCDRHRLTHRERLDLFMQVCEGVQHAHQKAIIHRDLKPTNVLVSEQDGKRLPKIIDFGVAKATAQKLTEKTLFTELGVLIGTPEYMSPEQADLTGEDVDTRTDVYSLGVILYELLVGALPFDSKELRSGGYDGIRKKIREEDPHKPSTRLSTLGDRSTESAKCRGVDLPTLQRQLAGDLDWITMRALEKDRSRRYGSPMDFAADIERYLKHEPVLASPPSAIYRTRKFVRRHRVGVAVAATGLLVLLAFAATMTVQARRIALERDRANQELARADRIAKFMGGIVANARPAQIGETLREDLREILAGAHRATGMPEQEIQSAIESFDELFDEVSFTDASLRMIDRGILEPATTAIEEKLDDDPSLAALLYFRIATMYYRLAMYENAEACARAALELNRQLNGDEDRQSLKIANWLAAVLWRQQRYSEAEELALDTLEKGERLFGSEDVVVSWSLRRLGVIYGSQGRHEESNRMHERVLEASRRIHGEDSLNFLGAMNNLANGYYAVARYDEAESLYLEAIEGYRRKNQRYGIAETMGNVGNVQAVQGRLAEAEKSYLEGIEACSSHYGNDHHYTVNNILSLSKLYERQARFHDAAALRREATETRSRVLGPRHVDTVSATISLAAILRRLGRNEESRALLDRVRPFVREELARQKQTAESLQADVYDRNTYAWSMLTIEPIDLRDPSSALRFALAANEQTGYEDPGFLDTLALAYHLTGDTAKAVETLRRALSALPGEEKSRAEFEKRLSEFEAALDQGE